MPNPCNPYPKQELATIRSSFRTLEMARCAICDISAGHLLLPLTQRFSLKSAYIRPIIAVPTSWEQSFKYALHKSVVYVYLAVLAKCTFGLQACLSQAPKWVPGTHQLMPQHLSNRIEHLQKLQVQWNLVCSSCFIILQSVPRQ